MAEKWKTVSGFSKYRVSDAGNLETADGKAINPANDERGRRSVVLHDDGGVRRNKAVATLVLVAFGRKPKAGHDRPLHIDLDLGNDAASNLKWGTASDQLAEVVQIEAGRLPKAQVKRAAAGLKDKSCNIVTEARLLGCTTRVLRHAIDRLRSPRPGAADAA